MAEQRPDFRGRVIVALTHSGERWFRLPLPQGCMDLTDDYRIFVLSVVPVRRESMFWKQHLSSSICP
jgi:hypothetical protein